MNKTSTQLLILLLLFTSPARAQISFNNGNLEGTPGTAGAAAPGWTVCAATPDIQPNVFCVLTPPHLGSSYAGFCTGEYIGQMLPVTLVAGTSYSFTAYITYGKDYASTQAAGACPDKGIRGAPGQLEIWGGSASCAQNQLMWSSPVMTTTSWVQFVITITPNAAYNYIMFKCPTANANVLVDDLSPIFTVPVQLVSFTGMSDSRGVLLKWATASEKNNRKFILERSADGITYSEVTAVEGAGNSQVNLTYGCRDDIEFTGILYYRLKQVDYDGKTAYSGMVSVKPCPLAVSTEKFFISSLNNNTLSVKVNATDAVPVTLFVRDMLGRLEYTREVGPDEFNGTISLDISGISDGMHLLNLDKSGEQSKVIKFFK